MLQPDHHDTEITLALVEAGATLILSTLAFLRPKSGAAWFNRVERMGARVARRKGLSVALVGLAAFLLRLAILPICPVPLPYIPDDFSFLLAADTFAHGRLTNVTPALWTRFESLHITMQPTYMSMYFPAQGLVLAASKVITGTPWYGLLITSALMCAAICWMLQAWLPPTWALLGGLLAVLRLGLFSYWINTYTGAGAIAALGGALVLGAMPRLIRSGYARYGALLAAGIIILVLSRPYEGMLLCIPVAVVLAHWMLRGKNRPSADVLIRRAALPLLAIVAAVGWLGYYDHRAFGNATTLPYSVDRATYAVTPYYVWQHLRPTPPYRHASMRSFYSYGSDGELSYYYKIHSVAGYFRETLKKAWIGILFFAGSALLVPLIMVFRVLRDHRIRFLVLCSCVLAAGMAIEVYLIPHYLAPFTAVFYAIGLQCMRHLRVWKPEGKPVGMALVRVSVALCFLFACVRLGAEPLHFKFYAWPPGPWATEWYGPGRFGTDRARVQETLEKQPGNQLAIVRYQPGHYSLDEWVYNGADIDNSKVVWAREMSDTENIELMRQFHDRKVWLVEPDASPARLRPYPAPGQSQTDPGDYEFRTSVEVLRSGSND